MRQDSILRIGLFCCEDLLTTISNHTTAYWGNCRMKLKEIEINTVAITLVSHCGSNTTVSLSFSSEPKCTYSQMPNAKSKFIKINKID